MIFSRISTAILGLIPAFYYKEIVDLLSSFATGTPEIASQAIAILFIILRVNLSSAFMRRVYDVITISTETNLQKKQYINAFNYFQKHSVNFFANNFSGSLIKKISKFTSATENLIDVCLYQILTFVINLLFILIVLGKSSIYFSIWFLIRAVVTIIIEYFLFKWIYPYQEKANALDSQISGEISDTISNYFNLKIFGSLDRETKNLKETAEKLRKARNSFYYRGMAIRWSIGLSWVILEFCIFYRAIQLRWTGQVSVGIFVLLQIYITRLISQMGMVAHIMRSLSRTTSEIQETLEILETPHEIIDHSNKKLEIKDWIIEFQNVTFGYNDSHKVFENLSFSIKPGERVALVGPSGWGKTTIGKLLFRFYDVQSGKILIDKQDISQITQDSLRTQIGMVPQDPILFHRSLKENILYGQPNATDEQMIAAAKMARCFDFIDQLPEKFETLVGERGIKLSGGERQRVAIARAILENASILVMDEATSALDSESEYLIQEAMEELMQNKTVIVIAHRLSTIMKMDKIFVIEQGKIVEKGSHKELLLKKGVYEKLRDIQSGGFIRE